MPRRALVALAVSALLASAQEAVILQLRVIEGDGAIHALGSRSGRPLVVQVADQTGKPVAGAAVTFRLPDEGPTGVFASGLRTEVAVTGADGRAAVWGIQWNRTAGPLQVRVTALKGQNRAGIVVSQYLSDAVPDKSTQAPRSLAGGGSRGKLFYGLLLVTAGAAAGGAAIGLSRYSKQPAQAAAAEALTAPPTSVGPPVISIGKP